MIDMRDLDSEKKANLSNKELTEFFANIGKNNEGLQAMIDMTPNKIKKEKNFSPDEAKELIIKLEKIQKKTHYYMNAGDIKTILREDGIKIPTNSTRPQLLALGVKNKTFLNKVNDMFLKKNKIK